MIGLLLHLGGIAALVWLMFACYYIVIILAVALLIIIPMLIVV